MQINIVKISDFLTKVDNYSAYIPLVSTVTSLVDLFEKAVLIPLLPKITGIDAKKINSNHYFKHINKKSYTDSILLLLPVIGNIAMAIINNKRKWDDDDYVFEQVKMNPQNLQYASERIQKSYAYKAFYQDNNDDPEFDVINYFSSILNNLSNDIKNDQDFMIQLIDVACNFIKDSKYPIQDIESILNQVSNDLKNNQQFVFRLFHYACNFIKDSEHTILDIDCILDQVSNDLKNNQKFMFRLFHYVCHQFDYPDELQYCILNQIGDQLQNDSNFFLILLQCVVDLPLKSYDLKRNVLVVAGEQHWNNATFMLNAMKLFEHAHLFLGNALTDNKEFILEALKFDDFALIYASKTLLNDKDFIIDAIQVNRSAYYDVSEPLNNDEDVLRAYNEWNATD